MNSNEHEVAGENNTGGTKRGQRGQSAGVSHYAKTDSRYWLQGDRVKKRQTTHKGGKVAWESPLYQVRMKFRGNDGWFGLGTANKTEAAVKAAKIYKSLQLVGWEETIKKEKPKAEKPSEGCTVGEFLEAARAAAKLAEEPIRPITFEIYARKFRSLVAEVFSVPGGKSKFDYTNGGYQKWLAKVHAIELERLTPDLVKKWRTKRLSPEGKNPIEQKRAVVSVNSVLRSSKSLFTEEIQKHLSVSLPATLPFHGVTNPKLPRSTYSSSISAAAILKDARTELEIAEGDDASTKHEMFKIILLGLCAGLRRDEVDSLTCGQINWEANTIAIKTTEFTQTKTDDSEGVVYVEPEVLAIIKPLLPSPAFAKTFVIHSISKTRLHVRYHHYRCDKLFRKVNAWLKSKGVTEIKAFHLLRKEFGSQINSQAGINAASKALRHSDISTTAKTYVSERPPAFAFTKILTGEAVTVLPTEPKKAQRVATKAPR